MDLKTIILQEHSKKNTLAVVDWVGLSSSRFKQLLALFLGDEYRVVQRSAWAISNIAQTQPELVQPFVAKIIDRLNTEGAAIDAVKRNVLRMIPYLQVPESSHDILLNCCFDYLANPNEAIAIRAFAMEVLAGLVKYYPEIENELILLIETELELQPSPGFISKSRKVLSQLKKKKPKH